MKTYKVAKVLQREVFYKMLNLSASLETRSTRMMFNAKISEALTKKGDRVFQLGLKLVKGKS